MKRDLAAMTAQTAKAYLDATLPSEMRNYTPFSEKEFQRPCTVAHAESIGPVAEDAEWHDARTVELAIALQVELADETNATAQVITKANELAERYKSALIDALGVPEAESFDLLSKFQEHAAQGIAFSMMQLAEEEDEGVEDRTLFTIFRLEGIAEPVTGS